MKKDDLYLLLSRLSKEEKAYINKKLSTFKENSVLKCLFEDVCLYGTHSKTNTDAFIEQKYGKHFRTRKKQLYYTILKILRNYHDTLIHQIHFYIIDINFLFEKGLFEQARKLLKKAKKLAEHNQIIPLYFELLYLELRMSYYTYYDNLTPEKINQIRADFSHYHQILKEDTEWALTTAEQLRDFFASGHFSNPKTYPLTAKGHLSFIQQHIIAGLTCRTQLDFEKSYSYRSSLWEYFKKYPELISLYPEMYLTAINMVIIGTNDLGKYTESLVVLDELSVQNIKAEIAQIEVFRIQATYYTQTHNFMQNYEVAYLNIEKQIQHPFYEEIHVIDKQLLHLHFAVACLGYQDYHKSIYYCYKVLNEEGNINVMALSLFLLLVAHLAQGDKEAIHTITQQYHNIPFQELFYVNCTKILTSSKTKPSDTLRKILNEYTKYDIKSRFVWEKYVNIELLIAKILSHIV